MVRASDQPTPDPGATGYKATEANTDLLLLVDNLLT
jgi:hypothetical protein